MTFVCPSGEVSRGRSKRDFTRGIVKMHGHLRPRGRPGATWCTISSPWRAGTRCFLRRTRCCVGCFPRQRSRTRDASVSAQIGASAWEGTPGGDHEARTAERVLTHSLPLSPRESSKSVSSGAPQDTPRCPPVPVRVRTGENRVWPAGSAQLRGVQARNGQGARGDLRRQC